MPDTGTTTDMDTSLVMDMTLTMDMGITGKVMVMGLGMDTGSAITWMGQSFPAGEAPRLSPPPTG